ncbi:MAG: alkaline phosphatase family protein [Candidatus Aminicenantia bacterium]
MIFFLLFLSSKSGYQFPSYSGSVVFEWTKGKKVTILQMDGLTLDFLVPLSSESKLPNFSHAMENGSWTLVKNFRPQDKTSLLITFETGKYPYKHLASENCYNFKGTKACFQLLPRFIFLYKLANLGLLEKKTQIPNFKGITSILTASEHPFFKIAKSTILSSDETTLKFKNIIGEFPENPTTKILFNAFVTDESVIKEAINKRQNSNPFYLHVFLTGLDTVEHYFWKYSRPEQSLLTSEEEIPIYSRVIERYYDYYDSIIGIFLSSLKEDEILLIYSPHGMSPITLWRKVLNFLYRTEEISAYHDNAPEGIAIFYGSDVRKNGFQGVINIVDIAPTLLYLMGFPVARDMDGNVIKRIVEQKTLEKNPIFFVRSYEGEISIKKKE